MLSQMLRSSVQHLLYISASHSKEKERMIFKSQILNAKKINIQMGADAAFIKVHSTHTKKSILHTAESLVSLFPLIPFWKQH